MPILYLIWIFTDILVGIGHHKPGRNHGGSAHHARRTRGNGDRRGGHDRGGRGRGSAVALWAMNEGRGARVMADSSGHGLHGSIGREVRTGTTVNGSTGYRFDRLAAGHPADAPRAPRHRPGQPGARPGQPRLPGDRAAAHHLPLRQHHPEGTGDRRRRQLQAPDPQRPGAVPVPRFARQPHGVGPARDQRRRLAHRPMRTRLRTA